ncbi:MAG: GldG family protein [SAR324 cluster bacterium]|nr:GldG family protein [SAR324 cluster bacterium]
MNPRSSWIKKLLVSSTGALLLLVSLVALNYLAGLVPLRLDITEEGLYTLSDGSKRILSNLDGQVTIKYYYSESLANAPLQVKNYARKVRELLDEYENAAGGDVTLEVYDPQPDTEEEEWAFKYGLQRIALPDASNLYFGMVVLSEQREIAVPFFDPRREKFLEYDISETIARVTAKSQPALGILAFLNVSGGQASPLQPREPEWAFMGELKKIYKVELLLPNLTKIPEHIDLLMIIHPKFLPSNVTYAIDQFVMRGGRLMIFADANARTDRQELEKQQGIRFTYSSIPDLFEGWGLVFDKTKIVGDRRLATRVNTQSQGIVDFPLWVSFRGDRINRDSVITSQLEEVTFMDGGFFEPAEDFRYTFTPLLTSSSDSGTIDNFMAQMAGPIDISRTLEVDGKERVMAALITGTFETVFPNGPRKTQQELAGDPGTAPEDAAGPPEGHLDRVEQENSIMVVGDADFMHDQFSVQRVSLFGRPIIQPINDNLIFLLNAVEFMSGSRDLIDIRSRGTFSRPFTTVLDLQQAAQEKYQQQEKQLSDQLEQVRERLSKLETAQGEEGNQRVILTPEILAEVEQFREEERRTQKALREVRKVLWQDIENLGRTLLALNLLAVPLLVAIIGFAGYYRRVKRSGGRN